MSKYNSFDKAKKDMVDCAFVDSENMINDKIQEEYQNCEFSDRHNERMEKFFADFDAKNNSKTKLSFAWYKIVACILGVVIVGSSVTIASVDALRENFLNFIFESDQPNTDFNFGSDEGTDYSDDHIILQYVPVGFELVHIEDNKKQKLWVFDRNDKYFQITVSDSFVKLSIDTEDASVEQITVQGISAICTSNDNIDSVIYETGNKSIMILGNVGKVELIKIANEFNFK